MAFVLRIFRVIVNIDRFINCEFVDFGSIGRMRFADIMNVDRFFWCCIYESWVRRANAIRPYEITISPVFPGL
jgi:hypothetical protein